MLVGIPGSGKSTICEELLKNTTDLTVLSTDEYIEKYAKERNKTYNEVHRESVGDAQKWMNNQIRALMNQKKNFIWDQTNVFKSARRKKITNLKQKKYNIVAVVLELTPEELNKRLSKRENSGGKHISPKIIQDMLASYERPSYEEGFCDIYLIKDDGVPQLIEKTLNLNTTINPFKKN